ncbi:MAG: DUF1778 domain-containing protein [Acidimicrobiales bacterium]
MTGFLLAAASERAETVLERAGRIALEGEAFECFVTALEAPVEPTLRRYAEQASPIPPS